MNFIVRNIIDFILNFNVGQVLTVIILIFAFIIIVILYFILLYYVVELGWRVVEFFLQMTSDFKEFKLAHRIEKSSDWFKVSLGIIFTIIGLLIIGGVFFVMSIEAYDYLRTIF